MCTRQGVPSLIFHLSDRGSGDLHIVGPPGTDAYISSTRSFVNRRYPTQHIVEVTCSGNEGNAENSYTYSTATDDAAPFAWAQAKTPGSGLEMTALPFPTQGMDFCASNDKSALMTDGSACAEGYTSKHEYCSGIEPDDARRFKRARINVPPKGRYTETRQHLRLALALESHCHPFVPEKETCTIARDTEAG